MTGSASPTAGVRGWAYVEGLFPSANDEGGESWGCLSECN